MIAFKKEGVLLGGCFAGFRLGKELCLLLPGIRDKRFSDS
jgi:hypothetical protein